MLFLRRKKLAQRKNKIYIQIAVGVIVLSSISCTKPFYKMVLEEVYPLIYGVRYPDPSEYDDEFVGSDDEDYDGEASLSENNGANPDQSDRSSTPTSEGPLKPIGFVNYGEFDATVRAHTFMPLGKTGFVTPPAPSTVSSANDGVGDWPNSSRFISVPMGAYSWCIDWEEGDIDDDGNIDYFHYIQDDPTILDENDSDDLESAEEVAISAPPSSGAIFEGKCKENLVDDSCVELNSEVNVYSLYAMEQGNPPQIKVAANAAEQAPPAGINVTFGGVSTGYGSGMILWQEGDWVEASTSDSYQALGVQVHGDQTIGWARVLFDGLEIWRGDASSYIIAEGRHGVYVEVRCFPPGTHSIRIEGLGAEGSGGGRSIPVSYFGFRE